MRSGTLEHHRSVRDALAPPPSPSSPGMEDLPEEIQLIILSLLPVKDAARTSTVSRNWRKLWTQCPNLCFDGTKDQSTAGDFIKIAPEFIEMVDSVIQHHSGVGLNKFSIRYRMWRRSPHLDRWIRFAIASKAKIIDINLWADGFRFGPSKEVYDFPLEALGAQDGPFIQSLFLSNVSAEPHSDICGFTKLRRLHLHYVRIIGDLQVLLLNCSVLEDLELNMCSGMNDLNIGHQLDKLKHLLISNMHVQTVEFHVPGLAHFEYQGDVLPVTLHGCQTLEKATISIEHDSSRGLGHPFIITGISAVKVLNMHATVSTYHPFWGYEVHALATRPTCMFMNLRHLTCEVKIFTDIANNQNGILQLANYLDLAPQLEVLQLHMYYYATFGGHSWDGEGTGEEISHMGHLDRLKKLYMSGFRGYRGQVELLCGILQKSPALEHVTIEPKVIRNCHYRKRADYENSDSVIPAHWIHEWARRAAERYGKVISVVGEQVLRPGCI